MSEEEAGPYAGYAEPEERPPFAAYATFALVFNGALAGAVAAAKRQAATCRSAWSFRTSC